jgi:hypothetical protein
VKYKEWGGRREVIGEARERGGVGEGRRGGDGGIGVTRGMRGGMEIRGREEEERKERDKSELGWSDKSFFKRR